MATSRKTPPKKKPRVAEPPPADALYNVSLDKGLQVLRAFDAAHRTMTMVELAALTGMSKGSVQRTVHTLQVLGYIGKHPQTRRFQLLPRVIEIGFNYLAAHPLIRAAHPYLSQLANASGETASLTEAVDQEMVYVAQLLAPKFIPVLTPVGMRIPMYCTSSGRAFLSRLSEAQARTLLEASARERRTAATLTDVDAIMKRVALCRKVGYATNCEELFLGDMGLAAAVIDSAGRPVGAVHVSPPTSRWTMDEAQKQLAPMVIECARAISHAMAH